MSLAYNLKLLWTTPYEKPPFKPIGFEEDLDAEDRNFHDIRKRKLYISIPQNMPRPSNLRECREDRHEPNWSAPNMDSAEQERLQFTFRGINKRWIRNHRAKLDLNDEFLFSELTKYEYTHTYSVNTMDVETMKVDSNPETWYSIQFRLLAHC
jgi:hypothetical protein